MKPGDLVRVKIPEKLTRDFHQKDLIDGMINGKLGIIVDLEMLINDKNMWNVMIDDEVYSVREQHLEIVNESR